MDWSDQPLGVAVVGLGFWGGAALEAVQRAPGVRLVSVVSRRPEQASEFARRYDCLALSSLEAALDLPQVEAVILTTGNPEHGAGIRRAARAGKHVLVEKPIANTVEEAAEAARAAETAGIVLAVGHQFRRTGAARATRQLIESGAIGEPLLAEANFSLPAKINPGSWKWSAEGCPGGPLIQLGIHHMDNLRYLLGEASCRSARLIQRDSWAPIPIAALAVLDHAAGPRSIVATSYASPRSYFIHIYGTEGNILYQTEHGSRTPTGQLDRVTDLTLVRGQDEEPVPFEPADPLVVQLTDFVKAVREGATVEVGAPEAIAALDLVWQAIHAAAPEA